MSGLRDTLVEELKDIYDAEKQLLKALPKMAKAAQNEELKEAFETHQDETQTQIERLEKVFEVLGETAKGKKCKAMQGLIEEGQDLIKEDGGDAALICAAQKIEHYEIASYGSLRAWADLLDEAEASDLFQETLDEEKSTDEKLTEIAETAANPEEEAEDSEEEEEDAPTRGRKH
ncbi:MAG: ferritin-like domain-containing protein [Verrucomicrobiia bacterium]